MPVQMVNTAWLLPATEAEMQPYRSLNNLLVEKIGLPNVSIAFTGFMQGPHMSRFDYRRTVKVLKALHNA